MKTKILSLLILTAVFAACSSVDRDTASDEETFYPKVGEVKLVN